MSARATGLYRLYRRDGTLLYIGIGYDPSVRIASHRRKSWGADIDPAKTTVDWHEDRDEAETAELLAVRTEKPLHNIVTADENGCARFLPYEDGAPRRGFRPSAYQQERLALIRRAFDERNAARAEYLQAIRACGEAGVSVPHLAKELGVQRKTLYRQMGRSTT